MERRLAGWNVNTGYPGRGSFHHSVNQGGVREREPGERSKGFGWNSRCLHGAGGGKVSAMWSQDFREVMWSSLGRG